MMTVVKVKCVCLVDVVVQVRVYTSWLGLVRLFGRCGGWGTSG